MDRLFCTISPLSPSTIGRFGVFFLLCLGKGVYSQELIAKVDPPEPVQGLPFTVTWSIRNADVRQFSPPPFKGCKVIEKTESPSSGFSNGTPYTQNNWSYTLTTQTAGKLNIPPATVSVGKQSIRSETLVLDVAPKKSGGGKVSVPPGANPALFVTAQIFPETAWPGRQLCWQLKVYSLEPNVSADILGFPGFDGFTGKERRRIDTEERREIVDGKVYFSRILHEESLFPVREGAVQVESARVRAIVDAAGVIAASTGKKTILLQSAPFVFKIKPLPPAPVDFGGAVGKYAAEFSSQPDTLRREEALVLKIRLKGNGNGRQIKAPALVLPDSFDVFEPKTLEETEYENGQEFIHLKTFEYVLIPHKTGFSVWRPSFTFFDPDSNAYRRIEGTPDSIWVLPAPGDSAVQASPDTLSAPAVAVGANPGIGWMERLLQKKHLFLIQTVLAALGAVAAGFWLFTRLKRRGLRQPVAAAATSPYLSARKLLATADNHRQNHRIRDFYDTLFRVIQTYLEEKLPLKPSELGQDIVFRRLSERKVPGIYIQHLLSVWQSCEQALYGGQPQSAHMESILAQTVELLDRLEESL